MRKNKMMRTASGLLVATLLTSSVLFGTFAKYTSNGSGSDSARIAKWGVTVTANGTMFADEYTTDDSDVSGTITESVVTSGNTGDAVVAPGTKGTLASAKITGTPEVAVNVAYKSKLTLTGWKYKETDSTSETEYFPIIFTINNQTYGIEGMKDSSGKEATNKSQSMSELITAVQNAIDNYSANYAPKKNLAELDSNSNGQVQVSWEWAYDKNDDIKDTYLGDQANKNNASKVELEITTTVSQID